MQTDLNYTNRLVRSSIHFCGPRSGDFGIRWIRARRTIRLETQHGRPWRCSHAPCLFLSASPVEDKRFRV